MGLKPWRNVETEKTRERYTQGCLGESPSFESQVYISSSFSFEPLPRSVFLLSLFLSLFLSVSLASLRPLSQANYLLVRYQIPPVLPVISCPVLPCSSALSSLFSPSCREILSNSSTRGSFSFSLSLACAEFFFDSPRRHFFLPSNRATSSST